MTERMRPPLRVRRRPLPFLIAGILATGGASAACIGQEPSGRPAAPIGDDAPGREAGLAPAAPAATASAMAAATPEPFPWEPVETVRSELSGALARADWPALSARVPAAASVMRYPSGAEVQELTADQLIGWLRDRWAAGVTVGEPRFVPHFPSLEAPTTGWRRVGPSGTTIHFVFHANPDTRRWFLDVLQYE